MFGGSSTLSENDCDLCVEILKSLYTLTMDWSDCSTYEEDPHAKEVFLKATPTIIGELPRWLMVRRGAERGRG